MEVPERVFKAWIWMGLLWLTIAMCDDNVTFSQIRIEGCSPLPSAFLVFGDSTADPGNNNGLLSIYKANFPPHGQDFMNHVSTGRFTNGKLITDLLSSRLGVEDYIPAYLDPEFKGLKLLKGTSFASGGSGYLLSTSTQNNVFSLQKQMDFFRDYKARLTAIVGNERAGRTIENALFCISTGTNDIINYLTNPATRQQYSVAELQDLMVQSLSHFIQDVYKEGARRIGVVGMPAVGCLPAMITLFNPLGNQCDQQLNNLAIAANTKIKQFLDTVKASTPGLQIIFVDIYPSMLALSMNPERYGFVESRKGCCGTGLVEAGILCNVNSGVHGDAAKYVYWDGFHPTTATYELLARIVLPLLQTACSASCTPV